MVLGGSPIDPFESGTRRFETRCNRDAHPARDSIAEVNGREFTGNFENPDKVVPTAIVMSARGQSCGVIGLGFRLCFQRPAFSAVIRNAPVTLGDENSLSPRVRMLDEAIGHIATQ